MKTITPNELQRLLETTPGTLVFDVRTPVEYAEAHVPMAVNEPLHRFDLDKLVASGSILPGKPVYLLCQTGARAFKAAEKLATAGHEGAVVVEGGTSAWIAAGLPIATAPVSTISLERQVRIVAGSLVLTGALLGWFVHPAFFGLSGFVGAGLIFAGITNFCGMGLLLARMPWNNRTHA